VCHQSPFFTDNLMHNLEAERFYEPRMINHMTASADGPIKTFPLRGIKVSPPYLHDGRLLTLDDTVEFFNLVLETKLSGPEKHLFAQCWPRLGGSPGSPPVARAAGLTGAAPALCSAARGGSQIWGRNRGWPSRQALQYQNRCKSLTTREVLERETRLELATSTLARLRSTN
jgi:hypothetical protein